MGRSQHQDPGTGIRDEQPGSCFLELRNHYFWVKTLKFFDADSGSGMETVRIRDKHPGSATLFFYVPVPEGDAAALAGGAQQGGAQPAVPHTRHSLPERLCRFQGSCHLRTE